MVGKYTDLSDAYLSVTKSLQHACFSANRKLQVYSSNGNQSEESLGHIPRSGTNRDTSADYLGLCASYNTRAPSLKNQTGRPSLVPASLGARCESARCA
eukprot:1183830-Prorocentrum_minimum.AAC.6